MIEIEVTDHHISVSGHARAGPCGQDTVCAAISALTQTFIWSVEELTDNEIKYDISPGRADIEIENPTKGARLLMGSFLVGCQGAADTYPEYVRVVQA